ncbi:MAG TPA: porin [Pseudolabrys sp.]|nr:porin [Pseudolabrys sp.]
MLGSAASLIAVTGAQSADLPVKAKPVEYVKICSLYGVGFYYIPGTDMCIKIGGWVRAEYGYGNNGNFSWGWANGNVNNRTTNNSDFRARGYVTADARNQSEYGTVRGYIAVGLSENEHGGDVNAGNQFSANRAFIQWAGFTFGRAQSFFDFYSVPATSYWGAFPASDTGDGGWFVMGYTAQFGNGFSATIAAEAPRKTQIINTNNPVVGQYAPGPFVGGAGQYGGFQAPDVVGNLRVDQAWGSAQIMGALHQVNATYYSTLDGVAVPTNGHPADRLGFVIGGGLKLNTPMISQGDYLQLQINYTQGALRYIFQTPNTNWGKVQGQDEGFGILTDGVFGGSFAGGTGGFATDVQLTTAWNVNAAFEHFWNPRWRTSLYGGYAAVSYNDTANALMRDRNVPQDWSTWWLGSRTQWNVTKDFYLGVDLMYAKLNSPNSPLGSTAIGGATIVSDVDNWQVRFRVHRDFYP